MEEKKSTSTKKSTNTTAKKKTTQAKKTTQSKKVSTTTTSKTPTKSKVSKTPKVTSSNVKENETKTPVQVSDIKHTSSTSKAQLNNNLFDIINPKAILIIILAFILCTILIVKGMQSNNKDYSKSYLLKTNLVKELDTNNITNTLSSSRKFVLVTKFNSEDEYNLEKGLKKIIEDNALKNDFYVFDIDKHSDVNISNIFNLAGQDITIPTILYYKNGEFIDAVKREDNKMIEAADFAQLLDIYEITE